MRIRVLEGGYAPKKAYFDDGGMDFCTPDDVDIKAGSSVIVDLKVQVQIPIGFFGKLESKSGLMFKHHIVCPGGVIDSSYRGNVRVVLENHGDTDYHFNKGDKVVQMIIQPCLLPSIDIVDDLEESTSGRNTNAYGSSGR